MDSVKLFFGEVDIDKLYTVVMYPWQSLSPAGQKVGMWISDREGNFLVYHSGNPRFCSLTVSSFFIILCSPNLRWPLLRICFLYVSCTSLAAYLTQCAFRDMEIFLGVRKSQTILRQVCVLFSNMILLNA